MRCFVLMMFITAIHTLIRSVGCALIIASFEDRAMIVYVAGGEIVLYLMYVGERNKREGD